MRVLIIGAGALGKVLAAFLSQETEVILYERNLQAAVSLKKNGFVLKKGSRKIRTKVTWITNFQEIEAFNVDVLIFSTKIMDLKEAVIKASKIKPQFVFLPQNGIFDYRWVERIFNKTKVCRGVTTMACQETNYKEVELFYQGNVYIGGQGSSQLAGLFRQCGLGAKAYCEPSAALWAKLIFSAVMNPIPVITAQGYEVLKKDQQVWRLVREAVAEGCQVAKVLKLRLAFDPLKLITRVRQGDLVGIKHRGTIFQDKIAGRKTELGFITGALIREARKAGIKTPALNLILARAKATEA